MAVPQRPVLNVVSALIRRDDELLMVRQAGLGEEPHWSTPGGQADDHELVTEALVREVREETGLDVLDPGQLAFMIQIDDRRAVQLHESRGAGVGYLVSVWTFEVAQWRGELRPADPDGLVSEAAFVPRAEARARLARIAWQAPAVAYLDGRLERGAVWLERRHADGRLEHLTRAGAT